MVFVEEFWGFLLGVILLGIKVICGEDFVEVFVGVLWCLCGGDFLLMLEFFLVLFKMKEKNKMIRVVL